MTVANGAVVTADFTLVVLAAFLQQVVAVGYGEQKVGEITSAVTNVTANELRKGPARDIAQALAGKVPGLGITTPSGDPRDTSQINLRGVTTIKGSTQPLIPIDGIPGNLETVPPTDIESVSVLRNGSAAAIDGDAMFEGKLSSQLNFVSRTQTHFDDGGSYLGAWRQTLIRNPTDRVQTETGPWQERGMNMYTNSMALILKQNNRFEGRTQPLPETATFRPFEGLRIALIGDTSGYQNFVDESFSANNWGFTSALFGYDALQRGNAEEIA